MKKEGIKLSEFATIKTNFEDADFWIKTKGSEQTVGEPTKEFSPSNIGVKVTATDVINPDYLFYVIQLHHQMGYFRITCYGTLKLKHIRVQSVKNILL